jgi:hypothetical protein
MLRDVWRRWPVCCGCGLRCLANGKQNLLFGATGAPKKKSKKKRRTYLPTFFLRFYAIFRSDFRKYFYGVFGFLMQRNGQKRDKKKSMGKDDRKKVFFSQLFRPKVFDMDFPQKLFYGVFELPLLRNAQKRHGKR